MLARLIVASIALSIPAVAGAQQPVAADTAGVRAVIASMFDAMRAGDTATMRAAFMPGVSLLSVNSRQDPTTINATSIDDFLASVGRTKERNPQLVLDERIGRVLIAIDDDLASAWTEYEFWAGDRFSHCGANSFTLVKTQEGWRIFQLADSRRTEGCAAGQS